VRKEILHPLIILIFCLMTSCRDIGQTMTGIPSTIETDISKLSTFISLPHSPASSRWRVIEKGTAGLGPDDWALMAILQYDETTAQILRTDLADLEPLENVYVDVDFIEDWFRLEIREVFIPEKGTDFLTLSLPRYPATQFAKPPLVNGYFFLTECGFVFLYLFTT
jgi:hypothetical protein